MRIAAPLEIIYYDKEAGKECIWVLIGFKLNMAEYESLLTGKTILLTVEEAWKHAKT